MSLDAHDSAGHIDAFSSLLSGHVTDAWQFYISDGLVVRQIYQYSKHTKQVFLHM